VCKHTYFVKLRPELKGKSSALVYTDLSADFQIAFIGQQNDGHINGSPNGRNVFEIMLGQMETISVAYAVYNNERFGPLYLILIHDIFVILITGLIYKSFELQ